MTSRSLSNSDWVDTGDDGGLEEGGDPARGGCEDDDVFIGVDSSCSMSSSVTTSGF